MTLLNNSADHALLLAIAAGSPLALERLYDRHGRWMFGLARRFVTIREDSEEVVQDVFAQVWREAARYDAGKATVATWLGIMTRSRALAFFQGLSHSEIARQTGTPLGTIKTRLRSALATLRQALEESRRQSPRRVPYRPAI